MVPFRYQNAGRPASRRETSGVTMTDVRHFTILCSPSFCRPSNNITLRSHPDGQYKMFIPNRREESQLCHIRFLVALLCRNDKMIVNLYFETASEGGSSAVGPWVGLLWSDSGASSTKKNTKKSTNTDFSPYLCHRN